MSTENHPLGAAAVPFDFVMEILRGAGDHLGRVMAEHPYCDHVHVVKAYGDIWRSMHGYVRKQDAEPTPTEVPDLIARGMSWDDTEKLMREACAQAGVQWDDEKEPQSIAINVMQRLANAAHKVGFKLALEHLRATPQPPTPALPELESLETGEGDAR